MVPTTFVGGRSGPWKVTRISPVIGRSLPRVPRLAVVERRSTRRSGAWTLRGIPSYERYTRRAEHEELARREPKLGRPEAVCAALIPIRKSEAWWALSHDERRAIFEEQSHHIRRGIELLPAIARRLYHSRDLGEPFDFLTWFEFAPEDEGRFEELAATLRATPEWTFVTREVDVRLVKTSARPHGTPETGGDVST